MDAQSRTAQANDTQEPFALGVPSLLETWKHHSRLLTHELDEASRELGQARRRIAQLVFNHDLDQKRLKQQEKRIVELESQVERLRDTAMTAVAHEAAGRHAAVFQGAYKGL